MSAPAPEDVHPDETEGFKVGESKTLEEYQQLGKVRRFIALDSREVDQLSARTLQARLRTRTVRLSATTLPLTHFIAQTKTTSRSGSGRNH
jgi:hypothetical protein